MPNGVVASAPATPAQAHFHTGGLYSPFDLVIDMLLAIIALHCGYGAEAIAAMRADEIVG